MKGKMRMGAGVGRKDCDVKDGEVEEGEKDGETAMWEVSGRRCKREG